MNTAVHFSSKTDLWATPQEFFNKLDAEFDFTLDVCANAENAKCENFYTAEDDGLQQPWTGVVWCNPPYGRGISEWVERAYQASLNGATVVMLIPARTDTRWFHRQAEIWGSC
jgi:phage N-6-adenine-methyltransferase